MFKVNNFRSRRHVNVDGFIVNPHPCGSLEDSRLAVGTGTWGIAAVIPKYLSLRLEYHFLASPKVSPWHTKLLQ